MNKIKEKIKKHKHKFHTLLIFKACLLLAFGLIQFFDIAYRPAPAFATVCSVGFPGIGPAGSSIWVNYGTTNSPVTNQKVIMGDGTTYNVGSNGTLYHTYNSNLAQNYTITYEYLLGENRISCSGIHTATVACGDGYVNGYHETCDDGNLTNGDGCESDCTPTPTDEYYTCGQFGQRSQTNVSCNTPSPMGNYVVGDPLCYTANQSDNQINNSDRFCVSCNETDLMVSSNTPNILFYGGDYSFTLNAQNAYPKYILRLTGDNGNWLDVEGTFPNLISINNIFTNRPTASLIGSNQIQLRYRIKSDHTANTSELCYAQTVNYGDCQNDNDCTNAQRCENNLCIDLPTINVGDRSVAEGNQLNFTISLSEASAINTTFNRTITPGTATQGVDYPSSPIAGSSSITAGNISKTIAINTIEDLDIENDETVNFTISNVAGAVITDATGIGTILNDDSAETNCQNNIDDDGDGLKDCADTVDCGAQSYCQYPETTCNDSFDNDGDIRIDCFDADCTESVACQVCGNGNIQGTEVCDDGNTVSGDGCNSTCTSKEPGFNCTGEPTVCSDINECNIPGLNNCNINASCTNTIGNYDCDCNEGYTGDGVICSDINECALGIDTCDQNSVCTNTAGSFECSCNEGYTRNGTNCVDIDECTIGTDDCNTNAACTNTPGTFTCTCNNGFIGDGNTCTDINECILGTDDCSGDATCTNTIGDFSCACNPGFTGDGNTCININECTAGTHSCDTNATCTDTIGTFTCACNNGFTGDGNICTDINECILGTDDCSGDATCTNTIGDFSCTCNPGFTGDGSTCININECTAGTHSCDTNATCTDTIGTFTCACNNGFTGDGNTCTDINECIQGTDDCNENATCTNTIGDFSCACNSGFLGDGKTCTDIDECANNPNLCPSPDATCVNLPGTYSCDCDPGFTGDGNTTCYDINECILGLDNCDQNATCNNTIGSFTCNCDQGYNGSGTQCDDIDECANNTDDCSADATCTNTIGDFECACNPGFTGNGNTCININECTAGTHSCDTNATCTDTIGTYTCACNIGYTGDGEICTALDPLCDDLNFTAQPTTTTVNNTVTFTITPVNRISITEIDFGDTNTAQYPKFSPNQTHQYQTAGVYTASIAVVNTYDNTIQNTCTTIITVETNCGNGIVESGEQCDDGDNEDYDGCTSTCQRQTDTFNCAAVSDPHGLFNTVSSFQTTCTAVSGTQCTTRNPTLDYTTEHNTTPSTTSCRFTCEAGYTRDSTYNICTRCGDNQIQANEECDDNNLISGDGCSSQCTIEPILCSIQPSLTNLQVPGMISWNINGSSLRANTSGTVRYDYPNGANTAFNPNITTYNRIYANTGIYVGALQIDHPYTQDTKICTGETIVYDTVCEDLSLSRTPTNNNINIENVRCQGQGKENYTVTFKNQLGTVVKTISGDPTTTTDPYDILSRSIQENNFTLPKGSYSVECKIGTETSNSCQKNINYCGNGIIDQEIEQCDDGNIQNGDGCSSSCTTEPLNCSIDITPSASTRPVSAIINLNGTSPRANIQSLTVRPNTTINVSTGIFEYSYIYQDAGIYTATVYLEHPYNDQTTKCSSQIVVNNTNQCNGLTTNRNGTTENVTFSNITCEGQGGGDYKIEIREGSKSESIQPSRSFTDTSADDPGSITTNSQVILPAGKYEVTCTVDGVSNPSPTVCTDTISYCGNNIVEGTGTSAEQCDDGNLQNGDGCSSSCKTESMQIGLEVDPTVGKYPISINADIANTSSWAIIEYLDFVYDEQTRANIIQGQTRYTHTYFQPGIFTIRLQIKHPYTDEIQFIEKEVIIQQQRDETQGCLQTVQLPSGTIGSIYYDGTTNANIIRTPTESQNTIPSENIAIQNALQQDGFAIAELTSNNGTTTMTIKNGKGIHYIDINGTKTPFQENCSCEQLTDTAIALNKNQSTYSVNISSLRTNIEKMGGNLQKVQVNVIDAQGTNIHDYDGIAETVNRTSQATEMTLRIKTTYNIGNESITIGKSIKLSSINIPKTTKLSCEYCGNKTFNDPLKSIESNDICDDGNMQYGDGCTPLCTLETPQCQIQAEQSLTNTLETNITIQGSSRATRTNLYRGNNTSLSPPQLNADTTDYTTSYQQAGSYTITLEQEHPQNSEIKNTCETTITLEESPKACTNLLTQTEVINNQTRIKGLVCYGNAGGLYKVTITPEAGEPRIFERQIPEGTNITNYNVLQEEGLSYIALEKGMSQITCTVDGNPQETANTQCEKVIDNTHSSPEIVNLCYEGPNDTNATIYDAFQLEQTQHLSVSILGQQTSITVRLKDLISHFESQGLQISPQESTSQIYFFDQQGAVLYKEDFSSNTDEITKTFNIQDLPIQLHIYSTWYQTDPTKTDTIHTYFQFLENGQIAGQKGLLYCIEDSFYYCGDQIPNTFFGNSTNLGGPNNDGFEECDEGIQGGQTAEGYCNSHCQIEDLASCGDGTINTINEQCDQGINGGIINNPNTENYGGYCYGAGTEKECTALYCGDGLIESSLYVGYKIDPDTGEKDNQNVTFIQELCDAGTNNGIPGQQQSCQDFTRVLNQYKNTGILNTTKEWTMIYQNSCEYCNFACGESNVVGPYCGDKITDQININGTNIIQEECDLGGAGNIDQTDANGNKIHCNNTCELMFCGNGKTESYQGLLPIQTINGIEYVPGYIQESCDDGNEQDNDGCDNSCQYSEPELKLEVTPKQGNVPLDVIADIQGTSPWLELISLQFDNEYTVLGNQLAHSKNAYNYQFKTSGTKNITIIAKDPNTNDTITSSARVVIGEQCSHQYLRNNGEAYITKLYHNGTSEANNIRQAQFLSQYKIGAYGPGQSQETQQDVYAFLATLESNINHNANIGGFDEIIISPTFTSETTYDLTIDIQGGQGKYFVSIDTTQEQQNYELTSTAECQLDQSEVCIHEFLYAGNNYDFQTLYIEGLYLDGTEPTNFLTGVGQTLRLFSNEPNVENWFNSINAIQNTDLVQDPNYFQIQFEDGDNNYFLKTVNENGTPQRLEFTNSCNNPLLCHFLIDDIDDNTSIQQITKGGESLLANTYIMPGEIAGLLNELSGVPNIYNINATTVQPTVEISFDTNASSILVQVQSGSTITSSEYSSTNCSEACGIVDTPQINVSRKPDNVSISIQQLVEKIQDIGGETQSIAIEIFLVDSETPEYTYTYNINQNQPIQMQHFPPIVDPLTNIFILDLSISYEIAGQIYTLQTNNARQEPGTAGQEIPQITLECPYCGNGFVNDGEICDDGKHCADGTSCTNDQECESVAGEDKKCKARDEGTCPADCGGHSSPNNFCSELKIESNIINSNVQNVNTLTCIGTDEGLYEINIYEKESNTLIETFIGTSNIQGGGFDAISNNPNGFIELPRETSYYMTCKVDGQPQNTEDTLCEQYIESYCGDGIVDQPFEECDEGEKNAETYRCTSQCTFNMLKCEYKFQEVLPTLNQETELRYREYYYEMITNPGGLIAYNHNNNQPIINHPDVFERITIQDIWLQEDANSNAERYYYDGPLNIDQNFTIQIPITKPDDVRTLVYNRKDPEGENKARECIHHITYPTSFCGDFIKNSNEQCDEGLSGGVIDDPTHPDYGRRCTENNGTDGGTCEAIGCGDGKVRPYTGLDTNGNEIRIEEQCDDGNQNNNDGCSNTCVSNNTCTMVPTITQQNHEGINIGLISCLGYGGGNYNLTILSGNEIVYSTPGPIASYNNIVPFHIQNIYLEPGNYEIICDIGGFSNEACHHQIAYCGNGVIDLPNEQCDDGNTNEEDYCDSNCNTINQCLGLGHQSNYTLTPEQVQITTQCQGMFSGDMVLEIYSGNNLQTPYQTQTLMTNAIYAYGNQETTINLPGGEYTVQCVAGVGTENAPNCSMDIQYCGDGKISAYTGLDQQRYEEQCDDRNQDNNDGCSNTCQREELQCGLTVSPSVIDYNNNTATTANIDGRSLRATTTDIHFDFDQQTASYPILPTTNQYQHIYHQTGVYSVGYTLTHPITHETKTCKDTVLVHEECFSQNQMTLNQGDSISAILGAQQNNILFGSIAIENNTQSIENAKNLLTNTINLIEGFEIIYIDIQYNNQGGFIIDLYYYNRGANIANIQSTQGQNITLGMTTCSDHCQEIDETQTIWQANHQGVSIDTVQCIAQGIGDYTIEIHDQNDQTIRSETFDRQTTQNNQGYIDLTPYPQLQNLDPGQIYSIICKKEFETEPQSQCMQTLLYCGDGEILEEELCDPYNENTHLELRQRCTNTCTIIENENFCTDIIVSPSNQQTINSIHCEGENPGAFTIQVRPGDYNAQNTPIMSLPGQGSNQGAGNIRTYTRNQQLQLALGQHYTVTCIAEDETNINLEICSQTIHFCGDGSQQATEQCDDGNLQDNDGCNQYCELEPITCEITIVPDTEGTVPYEISANITANNQAEIQQIDRGNGEYTITPPNTTTSYITSMVYEQVGQYTITGTITHPYSNQVVQCETPITVNEPPTKATKTGYYDVSTRSIHYQLVFEFEDSIITNQMRERNRIYIADQFLEGQEFVHTQNGSLALENHEISLNGENLQFYASDINAPINQYRKTDGTQTADTIEFVMNNIHLFQDYIIQGTNTVVVNLSFSVNQDNIIDYIIQQSDDPDFQAPETVEVCNTLDTSIYHIDEAGNISIPPEPIQENTDTICIDVPVPQNGNRCMEKCTYTLDSITDVNLQTIGQDTTQSKRTCNRSYECKDIDNQIINQGARSHPRIKTISNNSLYDREDNPHSFYMIDRNQTDTATIKLTIANYPTQGEKSTINIQLDGCLDTTTDLECIKKTIKETLTENDLVAYQHYLLSVKAQNNNAIKIALAYRHMNDDISPRVGINKTNHTEQLGISFSESITITDQLISCISPINEYMITSFTPETQNTNFDTIQWTTPTIEYTQPISETKWIDTCDAECLSLDVGYYTQKESVNTSEVYFNDISCLTRGKGQKRITNLFNGSNRANHVVNIINPLDGHGHIMQITQQTPEAGSAISIRCNINGFSNVCAKSIDNPYCGDGMIQNNYEECDPANNQTNGIFSCTQSCHLETIDTDCENTDIVLAIDTSQSIANELDTVKTLAKSFVEKTLEANSQNQIAIITFDQTSTIEQGLANINNEQAILNTIDNLTTTAGGSDLPGAYQLAVQTLQGSEAPNKLILLLSPDAIPNINNNGCDNTCRNTIDEQYTLAKNNGITTILTNRSIQSPSIRSVNPKTDFVFNLNNANQLNEVFENLSNDSCNCGNGVLEEGEQCDVFNGNTIYNSNIPTELQNEGSCDSQSCEIVGFCGDGYLDENGIYGDIEQCDFGEDNGTNSFCGNNCQTQQPEFVGCDIYAENNGTNINTNLILKLNGITYTGPLPNHITVQNYQIQRSNEQGELFIDLRKDQNRINQNIDNLYNTYAIALNTLNLPNPMYIRASLFNTITQESINCSLTIGSQGPSGQNTCKQIPYINSTQNIEEKTVTIHSVTCQTRTSRESTLQITIRNQIDNTEYNFTQDSQGTSITTVDTNVTVDIGAPYTVECKVQGEEEPTNRACKKDIYYCGDGEPYTNGENDFYISNMNSEQCDEGINNGETSILCNTSCQAIAECIGGSAGTIEVNPNNTEQIRINDISCTRDNQNYSPTDLTSIILIQADGQTIDYTNANIGPVSYSTTNNPDDTINVEYINFTRQAERTSQTTFVVECQFN